MTTAFETLEVEAKAAAPALEDYFGQSEAALYERIEAARKQLGSRLVILGHHYQRDDVVCHADYTGDSFKLAKLAAERPEADYVVFCGVHFMAESADILKPGDQKVILPDLGAGCSMADMATAEQVEDAWEQLGAIGLLDQFKVAPVTYMNSSASIKAFCGEHDGVVCTSSNAVPLFDKYLKEADKLFFFPDQHLGRTLGPEQGAGRQHAGAVAQGAAHPLEGPLLGARTLPPVARRDDSQGGAGHQGARPPRV
jgi:quinolinate synthase